MRGIVSGAALAALGDYGFLESFDAVYASSAGAINSAYFIAGDGWPALIVYYEELIGKKFLDPRRVFLKQPILSLDYVIDDVMAARHPLNYDRVISSPIELCILVTSVRDNKCHPIRGFATADDLKLALRASASVPLAAGAGVMTRDGLLLDGSILAPHPATLAAEDGYTHIVAIRTRGKDALRDPPSRAVRASARYLERLNPGLGAGYLRALQEYISFDELLKNPSSSSGEPKYLDIACVPGSHRVGRLTQNKGLIYEGMRAGYGAAVRAVEGITKKVYLRPVTLDSSPLIGP
jgi:predicted patatin/cPLA2 family phospholipase